MPIPRTEPILEKRYARSRSYDAANLRSISLERLRDRTTQGIAFVAPDTEANADVTRVLLA